MAEDAGSSGEEVSVGDLVVSLTGDGSELDTNLKSSLAAMDALLPAATRIDAVLASIANHATTIGAALGSLGSITIPNLTASTQTAQITQATQQAVAQIVQTSVAAQASVTGSQSAIVSTSAVENTTQIRDILGEAAKDARSIKDSMEEASVAFGTQESRTSNFLDRVKGIKGIGDPEGEAGEAFINRARHIFDSVKGFSAIRDAAREAMEQEGGEDTSDKFLGRMRGLGWGREIDVPTGNKREAYSDQFQRKGSGGGDGEDEEGSGHGMNHYLMRRIGYHAGLALGATGVGNEVTGIMTALEAFGPMIGGATIGAIVFVTILMKIHESMEQLRKDQIAYGEELRKTSEHWHIMSANQAVSSDLGKAALSESIQASDKAHDIRIAQTEEAYQANTLTGGFTRLQARAEQGFNMLHGGSGSLDDTTYGQHQINEKKKADLQEHISSVMRGIYFRQSSDELEFNQRTRKNSLERAQISSTLAPILKQRLELENEYANQQLQTQHKIDDQVKTARTGALIERDILQQRVDEAEKAGKGNLQGKSSAELTQIRDNIIKSHQDIANAAKDQNAILDNIQRDGDDQILNLYEKHLADMANLERQRAEQQIENENKIQQQVITYQTYGFERQKALQERAYADELAAAVRQGQSREVIDEIIRRNQLQGMNADKDHQTEITQGIIASYNQQLVAQRLQSSQEAQYRQQIQQIAAKETNNDTVAAEQTPQGQQALATAKAESARQLSDLMFGYQQKIDLASRSISNMDSEWNKFARDNAGWLKWIGANLDTVKQKFQEAFQAPLIEGAMNAIRSTAIDMREFNLEISHTQALYEKLIEAAGGKKNVSPALDAQLQAQAVAQSTLESARFARSQLEQLHNSASIRTEMEAYIKQLKEAVALGQLTNDQAKELAGKKLADSLSSFNPGEFSTHFKAAGARMMNWAANNPQFIAQMASMRAGEAMFHAVAAAHGAAGHGAAAVGKVAAGQGAAAGAGAKQNEKKDTADILTSIKQILERIDAKDGLR